jgi:D-lactate dehydrogenase
MKIVFFEIQGWEKSLLKQQLRGHQLAFVAEPLSPKNSNQAHNADIVSVFIYSKINKLLIGKLKKTKLIVTRSTGFDHIDVAACRKKKIAVCNVPYYGENTVAEHTFALVLALSRNVHKSYVRTIRDDFSIDGLKGFDLKGRTLGVIGAGHIGLHVIKIARGFGMNVLAYDVHQDPFVAEILEFRYVSLETLLGRSDIVSLHVPYNKATHHLINKKNIELFKKGAMLINTARGGLVETEALIKALDDKILAGAGLDVLEGEDIIKEEKQLLYDNKQAEVLASFVKDHILLDKDNVVFTPHIAFYSQEALERILATTSQNISQFLAGKIQNVV